MSIAFIVVQLLPSLRGLNIANVLDIGQLNFFGYLS